MAGPTTFPFFSGRADMVSPEQPAYVEGSGARQAIATGVLVTAAAKTPRILGAAGGAAKTFIESAVERVLGKDGARILLRNTEGALRYNGPKPRYSVNPAH